MGHAILKKCVSMFNRQIEQLCVHEMSGKDIVHNMHNKVAGKYDRDLVQDFCETLGTTLDGEQAHHCHVWTVSCFYFKCLG